MHSIKNLSLSAEVAKEKKTLVCMMIENPSVALVPDKFPENALFFRLGTDDPMQTTWSGTGYVAREPNFDSDGSAFQAVFDVFSWKYYLWAMKGDEPLLMKPSVVFTPFGTQILIPGYISFDPKRDLKLGIVSELYRARGIRCQGEGFSVGTH